MNIYSITKAVSKIGGGVFKMKTGHKIFLGLAAAVTAAAIGSAIAKSNQAKNQERSVKSLVFEDAAKVLPLTVKKPVNFEKGLEESSKPFIFPEQVKKNMGFTEIDWFTDDTFVLEPKDKTSDCILFYIHGTDFWSNPTRFHYSFFKKLTNKLGAKLVLPVYPKAPAHTAVEIQKMLLDRYMYLIEENQIPADKIVFIGDGAGGGLVLSLLQKIKYQTLPMPKQAFLISPWLDVTNSDPKIAEIQPQDKLLNAEVLKEKGELYAGDLDLMHPAVSPIYGDLTGLCKITVFAGTREIFCADAYTLQEIADEYELDIDVNIYKNQMHFFVGLPIPEAEEALAIMASELYGVEECKSDCEEEAVAEDEEAIPDEAEPEQTEEVTAEPEAIEEAPAEEVKEEVTEVTEEKTEE